MKLSNLFSENDGFARPNTPFWWASCACSNHLALIGAAMTLSDVPDGFQQENGVEP
jgi:hypothetical protein